GDGKEVEHVILVASPKGAGFSHYLVVNERRRDAIHFLKQISMALGLYYYGLRDTNAAYSVNFLNLIPIVTFIIAVILRLERMRLRSTAGKVKVLGTLLCVGGTMIVSLYKGKALHLWPTHLLKLHHGAKGAEDHHHWLRGTLFLVKLFKIFPSKYWATMLTCVAGSLETVVIGIIIDREKSAWMLKWDLQLLTIVATRSNISINVQFLISDLYDDCRFSIIGNKYHCRK
ncbi:WAT1-related protein, partial [Ananas comosus]